MNFQEKVIEASAQLRERAAALADAALGSARERADRAAQRVEGFRKSLIVLNDAGKQLNKVARLHAGRFVKQNSPLVTAVRKDVSELARSTFATLTRAPRTGKPARKTATSRRRTRKAA
jgi:hypothetical protein